MVMSNKERQQLFRYRQQPFVKQAKKVSQLVYELLLVKPQCAETVNTLVKELKNKKKGTAS